MKKAILTAVCAIACTSATAQASGTEDRPWEANRATVGLGLGVETTEDGETAPVLSLSYNLRLSEYAGIGVGAEYAFGDIDTWVVGVPVRAFLTERWVLTAMPAAEIHNGDLEFLFRLGLGYEFENEGYSITPELNVDFVDGKTNYVFAVVFGF